VAETIEAEVGAEKAAVKPAKAPKKASKETPKKAPKKVKKAKPAKKVKTPKVKPVEKVAGKPRGLAQFAPGTKLTTVYKGEELVLTVLEDSSIERNGTAYPNLAQFVDAFAGKGNALHLRAIGTWKVVE